MTATLDALNREWNVWLEKTNSQGKNTQAENWRNSNPGEYQKLITYRSGGARPTLVTAFGRQMVEHVDAWLSEGAFVPPSTNNRLSPLILSTPTTIIVDNAHRDAAGTLQGGKDYVVIIKPGCDGLVRISGGRNVNVFCESSWNIKNTSTNAFWDHTGLSIYNGDANSTVYVENARVLGATVNDGVVWNAPTRNLRIQTCRVEASNYAAAAGYHPDGFQSQGGCKSLEMDKITAYSPLQCLFLGDHDGPIGPVHVSRMNAVGAPGKYLFWKSKPHADVVILEDCWMHMPNPWAASPGRWVYPNELGEQVYSWSLSTDKARVSADGKFVDFPGMNIQGGWNVGMPPNGDFVPA